MKVVVIKSPKFLSGILRLKYIRKKNFNDRRSGRTGTVLPLPDIKNNRKYSEKEGQAI